METERPRLLLGCIHLRDLSDVSLLLVSGLSATTANLDWSIRLRQIPKYKIAAPPPELATHFPEDKFLKAQQYGAAKARFSIVSGLINQLLDTAFLVLDVYPKTWILAGTILARFGYDESYEVSPIILVSEMEVRI